MHADGSNPTDKSVARSIEERKNKNPRKYSIKPSELENVPFPASELESQKFESEDEDILKNEGFEDLSSDKEEDTTEGEITDTHASE